MKIPQRLQPLVEDGLVDAVVRQLKSGKEAEVYVVRCGDDIRCAKVYKDTNQRGFRSHAQYQEGRKVRNSRRARAMEKGTRYGRREQETVWQTAEVDALYRLADAGVRVPQPYNFIDGILIMERITDADGRVAPRLDELELTAAEARDFHRTLITDVVRMLCAGLVHGDLSEYNVLVDANGPVIIDLPQAVNAAGNNNAGWMFERDVNKLADYFSRFAPELAATEYGKEIWAIYESGELTPATPLTGHFEHDDTPANVDVVMLEIEAAREEAEQRERALRGDADEF